MHFWWAFAFAYVWWGANAFRGVCGTFLWTSSVADVPPSATNHSKAETRLRTEVAAELVLMAIGRHASFADSLTKLQPVDDERPHNGVIDQRQHVQAAIIVLHLLQSVRYMRTMDEQLTAAVDDVVASVSDYKIAMDVFFEMVRRKVEQDVDLSQAFADSNETAHQWYRSLPATRKRFSAARTVGVRSLLTRLSGETVAVKKLVICTVFLDAAVNQQHATARYSRLANNVFRLAKNKNVAEHVERVFQNVVDEMARQITDVRDERLLRDHLLTKLLQKLRNDVFLNSEPVLAQIRR